MSKQLPLSENHEAIVLWRRKRKNYSIYSFLVADGSIIVCSVPHRRLQSLRSAGYLQPFSQVVISVVPDGEYYTLQQIEGQSLVRSLGTDLDSICYAAFIGELVVNLFRKGMHDVVLYELMKSFVQAIQTKPVPVATVVLGWQLLSHAGFMPVSRAYSDDKGVNFFWQEVYSSTGLAVSPDTKRGMDGILAYSWHPESTISLPKQVWKELEQALFAYTTVQLDKELESVKFLRQMRV